MNTNIILTILLIFGTLVSLNASRYFLRKVGELKKVGTKRIYYVSKIIYILIMLVSLFVLALIWSVSLNGVLIFGSSIFAVIGVALFAQWSILSNITSSVIIFFNFPTKVGDKIMILDGDNSVTGTIIEISLFQIEVLDDENNIVLYPNSLFIQKPIKKLHQQTTPLLEEMRDEIQA